MSIFKDIRKYSRRIDMRVPRMIIALSVLLFTIFPMAAQTISEDKKSEYYYTTVYVEKIFPYRKGYVVYYRKGLADMARTYLPLEWFTETAGKGDLVRIGPGSVWPSLTVFYKNGEFDHVRLIVRREMGHETWGNIPLGVNLDSHFENVEDIKLEF
jgi:hypothetical protein